MDPIAAYEALWQAHDPIQEWKLGFWRAYDNRDLKELEYHLKNAPPMNQVPADTERNVTMFHTVCSETFWDRSKEGPKILQLLHRFGSQSLNQPFGPDQRLSLHAASYNGQIKILQTLIQLGADITLPNQNGSLPIHDAIAGNQVATVKFWLQLVPTALQEPIQFYPSLFHLACNDGDMTKEMLIFLTHHLKICPSAWINIPDPHGETPIYAVIREKNYRGIRNLIRFGADVDFKFSPDTQSPAEYSLMLADPQNLHLRLPMHLVDLVLACSSAEWTLSLPSLPAEKRLQIRTQVYFDSSLVSRLLMWIE